MLKLGTEWHAFADEIAARAGTNRNLIELMVHYQQEEEDRLPKRADGKPRNKYGQPVRD